MCGLIQIFLVVIQINAVHEVKTWNCCRFGSSEPVGVSLQPDLLFPEPVVLSTTWSVL